MIGNWLSKGRFFRKKLKAQSQVSVTPAWYLTLGVKSEPVGCTFFVRDRLAIVHTHPTFSPQGRFVVVGDLWLSNGGQLLQGKEVNPVTDLDIVAFLWERWGIDCLQQLEGVFSLAIWDRSEEILWLVRDRTGAKTLYYTTGSQIWVAPRLRTLKPYHSDELDSIALRDYLCCAFVPGERTLWQQVRELRPGTVLQLPERKSKTYWEPAESIVDGSQPLEWHGAKLRSLLDDIIEEYLPKSEPVGVYLSGGLDSSCITALASQAHNAPVHTYSIHFGADCPNELEFSSLVAQHCHTQHHILEIPLTEMWKHLPTTMAHLDDPIGDPLTVPNYLLAQLAKQDVGVILNGEGGDPCFGGPKNQPMLLKQLYGDGVRLSELVSAYLTSFKKCALDLPQLLHPDVMEAVNKESSVFAADLSSSAKYINRLMALNIKYKGADHILTKVNNLTGSAGIEGRSPLFDRRIVEIAMQIPPEYKLAGASEKAVLKQAVADLLPEAIIKRPKSGMMVPVQLGFRKYWQREARSLLLDKQAAIAPYFNRQLIEDWLNYRGDLWKRYGVKLWLLVSLEFWLQAYSEK